MLYQCFYYAKFIHKGIELVWVADDIRVIPPAKSQPDHDMTYFNFIPNLVEFRLHTEFILQFQFNRLFSLQASAL